MVSNVDRSQVPTVDDQPYGFLSLKDESGPLLKPFSNLWSCLEIQFLDCIFEFFKGFEHDNLIIISLIVNIKFSASFFQVSRLLKLWDNLILQLFEIRKKVLQERNLSDAFKTSS